MELLLDHTLVYSIVLIFMIG